MREDRMNPANPNVSVNKNLRPKKGPSPPRWGIVVHGVVQVAEYCGKFYAWSKSH
jgi:hypothetical protein